MGAAAEIWSDCFMLAPMSLATLKKSRISFYVAQCTLTVKLGKKTKKTKKKKQKTKQLCNSLGVKGIKNILIAARIYTKTYTNTAEIDGKTAVGFLYDQS